MSEIKKCPFCNSIVHEADTGIGVWMRCVNLECPIEGVDIPLTLWITRPIEDNLRIQLASLQAQLDGFKEGTQVGIEMLKKEVEFWKRLAMKGKK